MATVTKDWGNGDLLTLITSAGGIAVTSDENLTGTDRQMTIQVQTDVQEVTAELVVKQKSADGYWVHKDTGVTTYYGLTGTMSTPSWKNNAKEIKVPTGVTELAVECFANSPDLEVLILPDTLTTIKARVLSNTKKMRDLRIHAVTPPSLNSDLGYDVGDLSQIQVKVPAQSVNAYKSAPVWSNFSPFIVSL